MLADRLTTFIRTRLLRRESNHIPFPELFIHFQEILEANNRTMEIIADMEDKLSGQYVFDSKYMQDSVAAVEQTVLQSAYNFNFITDNRYFDIYQVIEDLMRKLKLELAGQLIIPSGQTVLPLGEIQEAMDEAVGNKAFNLFRVMNLPQTRVPGSFVVSIAGFHKFLAFNNLFEKIDNLRFAGLHDSFLNVPFRELLSCYKKVLASMFTPGSLEYRINRQVPLNEMAMAVLYQEIIPGTISGVAYTLDPNSPQEPVCLLGANWGLGKVVVEGSSSVDLFRVSRKQPYAILESRINEKKWMMDVSEASPGTRVQKELQNLPCLTPDQISGIVETALIIERFFKRPLDIEWCIDDQNRLVILQARPLGIHRQGKARSPELSALLRKQRVLLKEQGIIAYRGVGSGPVWIVDDKESIEHFPSGAVLVARYAIPLLSRALPRACAVITDVGSPTGHMATVAREFQIPTIVDTGNATTVLQNGREITVDAERNTVYEGRIDELLHHQLLDKPLFETRYEFQILRRLLRRLSPLTLVDPEDPGFTAKGCKTFHDVIRFMHEKSIQALLQITQQPSALMSRGGKRLKTRIPLNLILIDIGGGLDESTEKSGWVTPDKIISQPMKALWSGMDSENTWDTAPISADFKGLMSGVTRTQASVVAGQTLTGLNIAVLGANYMNLTLRVGYHFTVVDALMGSKPEKNTIFFRFVGGATDISRRSRRATLLVYILEKIGFKV
ncbi:MAG: PEP/pyruvate-binding domain-containing protein, partial [Desulfofustis sp.]